MKRIALALFFVTAPALAGSIDDPLGVMPSYDKPVTRDHGTIQPIDPLKEQLHIYKMSDHETDYRYEYGPSSQPDTQIHDYSGYSDDPEDE